MAAQSKQAVGEGGENSGNWEGEAGLAATLEEVGGRSSLVSIVVFCLLNDRALKR